MKEQFEILLADDSEDDVIILRQAVRKAGLKDRLHGVKDGEQAIAYLNGDGPYGNRQKFPFPDFVLLDLNMPGVDGFQVIEAVRGNTKFGPLMIHVLSLTARPSDVRKAYSLGASSFILKPSRLDALVELVATIHRWHELLWLPHSPASDGPPVK